MTFHEMCSWKEGRREKNGREEEGKDGRGREGWRKEWEGRKARKKMKECFILNLKNYCETAAEGNSKKNIQQLKYSKTQKTNEKWL